MRGSWSVGACLAGALGTWVVAAPPKAPKVTLASLPTACTWIGMPKAFEHLGQDSLSITAGPETDLYNDPSSGTRVASAPMLVFEPDKTFVLTAHLQVDFQHEYDGGFLVVFADKQRWAKLLFEKSHYGPFSVCSNVTRGASDDNVHGDVAAKDVHLRITRNGELFTFYMSTDGSHWTYVRVFRFPDSQHVKVGFASQAPAGQTCTTMFTNIRYTRSKPGDFWTGEPQP